MTRLAAAAALLLLGAAPSPPAQEPIAYTLSPVFAHGELSAVAVTLRFRGDPGGRTTLDLPDDFGGVKDHWRYLSALTASGADLRPLTPGSRLLVAPAGALVTVRYRVTTAYAQDPAQKDGNSYDGAAIRPRWFASLGEFLFATVHGRPRAPARFRWTGWPAGWTRVSDLDHGTLGHAMVSDDIGESTLLAGPGVQLRTRPISGGTLRLATRGTFAFSPDTLADATARTLDAQRRFWGDVSGPFTVTLFGLTPNPGASSSGGTGRGDGFALYATSDIDAEELGQTLAHEHIHSWIPRRIGEMPEHDEAALFWLSEGFTDFYAARTQLRAGITTPEQFAAELNAMLAAYAASPVRTAPNSRIVTGFWTEPAVEQLPYQRGRLFAY